MDQHREWDAQDYAEHSSEQLRWARELVSKLRLEGRKSVVDIGCGDGKVTAEIARATSGQVHGIDLSQDMVAFAQRRYPRSDYPNLSFSCMDAASLALSDGFDIAFSNAALHWVEDHCAVLRGIRAGLKPGGEMLLQMGGRGNAAAVFDAVDDVVRDSRWNHYYGDFQYPYHFHGPEEYEECLEKNRFRPARIELLPKDMLHRGKEGLKGWLRTTWFPYTDRLPQELRNDFLTDIVENFAARHPADTNGNIHVHMVRLEVEARALCQRLPLPQLSLPLFLVAVALAVQSQLVESDTGPFGGRLLTLAILKEGVEPKKALEPPRTPRDQFFQRVAEVNATSARVTHESIRTQCFSWRPWRLGGSNWRI